MPRADKSVRAFFFPRDLPVLEDTTEERFLIRDDLSPEKKKIFFNDLNEKDMSRAIE